MLNLPKKLKIFDVTLTYFFVCKLIPFFLPHVAIMRLFENG